MGLDAHNPHMDQNERVERVSNDGDGRFKSSYMNRYPNQFSGGQRQRIGLGKSINHESKVSNRR